MQTSLWGCKTNMNFEFAYIINLPRGHLYISRMDIGVGGGPENGNFPLLYVVKCPYVGWWVVQKSLKTPLSNIKMAP